VKCYAKDESDGNPAHLAYVLAEDTSGDIWFGCQMLCRWSGSSISHYMQEQMDHPSGNGVVALAAGASGSLWVAMDGVGSGLECAITVMEALRATWSPGSMAPLFER